MRIETCIEHNGQRVVVCVDDDTVRVTDQKAVRDLIQVLRDVTGRHSTDRQRLPVKPGRRPIYCETCQFWEDDECRRYPPTIHGKLSKHDKISVCSGHFPLIDSDEWCGEWQERDESGESKHGNRQGESNETT